jgi:glycosyltransferase involved in cell wall biosynthesis
MLIGIDASRAGRQTGTERYSLHLIRELVAQGRAHQFCLYRSTPPVPGLLPCDDRVAWRTIPFPRLWTHVRLSWEMTIRQPDLLFVPSHVLPVVHPRRSVVTVHDLGYRFFPQAHPRTQRWYLDLSTRYNAHAAVHVVADSEATRRDLAREYGVDPGKITVSYPGRDESLRPVTDPAALAQIRSRYELGQRYFLYLGTLQPRKNLVRLLEAFHHFRSADAAHQGVGLVLAGRIGWLAREILATVARLGLERVVRLPGFVPDEDRAPLLSGARAFLFPSLYEGFGFPVLEAMACGTPVLCSDTSSLPEVAGEAAWLVDPLDVGAIAAGMAHLAADEELRRDLVGRGFEQVRRFSWRRCGTKVLAVLEEVGRAVR